MDLQRPSLRALATLADNSAIPFIVARYQVDMWSFDVMPANGIARRIFRPGLHTELEFVTALHRLRGRAVPPEIAAWLRRELPPI